MSDLETPSFEDHYRGAFQALRGALIDLCASRGADPATPQELARRFQLNRGLTWKVARVAAATDPFEAYPQIPGSSAIAILLKAFKKSGASSESLSAVRDAFDAFESMIEQHAGDRATLELMIDSCSPDQGRSEPLEMSRKLAFRGNSGIRGMQAKTRVRTMILAPNADDPDMLDTVQISGMIRLRRFRANAKWPLFVRGEFNDDGTSLSTQPQPLFPGSQSSDFLMADYCSLPLPEIKVTPFARGTVHELGEGPVGNSGVTDILYGSLSRKFATRYRDEANEYGECFADINAPVEALLFDVVLHEDLSRDLKLETKLFSGEQARPLFGRHSVELPCPEQVQKLGSVQQGAATPLMPRYKQMLESVLESLNWDPARFQLNRLEMKFPPVPSSAVVRFPLEVRS